jgi:type VI secretion system protein ImpA
MDMTDLEALLRPVSDEASCGPDLDAAGDPAYVELGVAAEWKEAKYVGDQEVAPAVAPDWRQVKESAAALLAISKDLRIAKHYVAALAHTEGLPGFAAGVRLLHDLIDRYWDALHPALEGADDDWRRNLVTELNAERGALAGLREAPIAESRKIGRFALRDIEAAEPQQIHREAIRDSDREATAARAEACRQALAGLKGIKAVFAEHQPGLALDFPAIEKLLRRAQQLFDDALGIESEAPAAQPAEPMSGNGSHPGALKSRADARRALESVCEFLERTEPAHPAPLLIRRAARLLDLNFLDIIRDIAPAAATQIEDLSGLKRE